MKITEYPTATTISSTEDIVLIDGPNGTRKITIAQLFTLMAAQAGTLKDLNDWKTSVLAGNTNVVVRKS